MTIDLPPEIEAEIEAKARAEGVSVGAYVERLVFEENSRLLRLARFRQAVDKRVEALGRGESQDGEEVMTRLIAELDVTGQPRGTR